MGGNIITNVTNQLLHIVWDVQYIFLFQEFYCILQLVFNRLSMVSLVALFILKS